MLKRIRLFLGAIHETVFIGLLILVGSLAWSMLRGVVGWGFWPTLLLVSIPVVCITWAYPHWNREYLKHKKEKENENSA